MSTFDIVSKAIADYDREHPPETSYDVRLREKREAREAEVAEWCERLARDAKDRGTQQAVADNSAAWAAWFHNAFVSEFTGDDRSPIIEGIAEFVSEYTAKKRAELRDELRAEFRQEFADQQRTLEARCAALEQRLENVTQGKRKKFAFARGRTDAVKPPSRRVVRKVRTPK